MSFCVDSQVLSTLIEALVAIWIIRHRKKDNRLSTTPVVYISDDTITNLLLTFYHNCAKLYLQEVIPWK